MPRWCRLLLLLFMLIALAGCQADASLRIRVHDDGGGEVTVAVDADPQAAANTLLLDGNPLVSDLTATGWAVTGPTAQPNGWYQMTATKSFSRPDQLAALIQQVAGSNGPLKGFKLDQSTSFAKRSYSLVGTVDLRGGIAVFSDEELTKLLGGMPIGQDKAALDKALGKPFESLVTLDVVAFLPGSIGQHNGTLTSAPPRGREPSTTATTVGGPAASAPAAETVPSASVGQAVQWKPSFADAAPLELRASSSDAQLTPRLWRWLAIGAAVLGACVLLYQGILAMLEGQRDRRRDRRRPLFTGALLEPEPEPVPDAVRPVARVDELDGAPWSRPPGDRMTVGTGPSGDSSLRRMSGRAPAAAEVSGNSGLRLLVIETAGILFDVQDPVTELLMPHVRSRNSTVGDAEIRDWYVARVVGGVPPEEFWGGLDVFGDAMLLDDSYARRYELSPDILEFLRGAAERGLEVATLGDEVPEWTGVFRQRFGLDEVIGAWVSSGEVGVRPPHPALLEMTWRTAGFAPENAMVIARSVPLLDIAHKLGARTVQYAPNDAVPAGAHPQLRSFTPVPS
jgi:hypothetical protein